MQKVTPTPRTLTLRFKHNRTTILIEADPLQKLAEVRAELLAAIQATNPSGKLNDMDIPHNPDDILLGRAVDRNDLELGYISLHKETDEVSTNGKGKGKDPAGSGAKGSTSQIKDSPQGAGLKNGDIVVFKFREEDESQDDHWDVVIPTLEDTYGDEEAQDEGIGMEE